MDVLAAIVIFEKYVEGIFGGPMIEKAILPNSPTSFYQVISFLLMLKIVVVFHFHYYILFQVDEDMRVFSNWLDKYLNDFTTGRSGFFLNFD